MYNTVHTYIIMIYILSTFESYLTYLSAKSGFFFLYIFCKSTVHLLKYILSILVSLFIFIYVGVHYILALVQTFFLGAWANKTCYEIWSRTPEFYIYRKAKRAKILTLQIGKKRIFY